MDFKNMSLKSILLVSLAVLFLVCFLVMKFSCKTDSPIMVNNEDKNLVQNNSTPVMTSPMVSEQALVTGNEEDTAIQQQLDRDRKQQKQTKDLKIKLEQTNLELEEQKALAEINKLKNENNVAFNEPGIDGQNNLPEIKIDYIGGDIRKKEAILSITGINYQVKEKSNPISNIQVLTITDSSVTVHFGAPQDLTKTFDYKPE